MRTQWGKLEKILCVRLDSVGAVLMSTPAIRALAQRFPQAHLSILASVGSAVLAPFLSDIQEFIAYDAPWARQRQADGVGRDLDMLARLRAASFDAAVIFTSFTQSALPAALFCRLAGIPRILGHAREDPHALLDTWAQDSVAADGGRHEVQRQLDLVALVGARTTDPRLLFALRDQDRAGMHEKLMARGVDTAAGFVVIHTGASAEAHRYPAEYLALVVRRLAQRIDLPILVTASSSEYKIADSIVQAALAPAINLAGGLSLGEFAALIEAASVLVSNNSSPVHIAAALGTPVVDLYALTNPHHTPWRLPHRLLYQDVPCRYCYRDVCAQPHHACLRGVEPNAVVEATLALLRLKEHSHADDVVSRLPAVDATAYPAPAGPVPIPVRIPVSSRSSTRAPNP